VFKDVSLRMGIVDDFDPVTLWANDDGVQPPWISWAWNGSEHVFWLISNPRFFGKPFRESQTNGVKPE
jgi:hypothetical protein